jgi:hypothetical protein
MNQPFAEHIRSIDDGEFASEDFDKASMSKSVTNGETPNVFNKSFRHRKTCILIKSKVAIEHLDSADVYHRVASLETET